MSIASLRSAVTAAGGTPSSYERRALLRELITAWGGTPAQWTVTGLLREAITAKAGTPSGYGIVPLLRELVTALGGTPATYEQDALEAQVAGLAESADLGTLDIGAGDAGTFVFEATIPAAGLADDFSDLRIEETDGTPVPFWVDPQSIIVGTSALAYVRVADFDGSSRTLNYCAGGSGLSDGAATFDIFMDPASPLSDFDTSTDLDGACATIPGASFSDPIITTGNSKLQGFTFSPDGLYLFTTEDDDSGGLTLHKIRRSDNTEMWSVPSGTHGNSITYRADTDTIVTGGPPTADDTFFEYDASDGSLVRTWSLSTVKTALGAGVSIGCGPMYAGAGKLLLAALPWGTLGMKFVEVTLNDADGTMTVGNIYTVPAATSFASSQNLNGSFYDYTGAIRGDATPRVFFVQNAQSGTQRPGYVTEVVWVGTTVGKIVGRSGPHTLDAVFETEDIDLDPTSGKLALGSQQGGPPAKSSIQLLTWTAENSTFGVYIPQENLSSACLYSKGSLSDFATGKVRLRARARWSAIYDPRASGNQRAGLGFQNVAGGGAANTFAQVGGTGTATTKTQAIIRTGTNGAGAITGTAFAVTDRTDYHLWQVDLDPGTSVTVSQNGSQVGQATSGVPTVADDYPNLRAHLGFGKTSSANGTDHSAHEIVAYALQDSASDVTVTAA